MTWAPRILLWRDALFCWRLARDPSVRNVSGDTRMPGPVAHLRWMWRWAKGALRGERMAWIIEQPVNGGWRRVGLVRVHTVADRTLEFGIALTHVVRGRGMGTDIIRTMSAAASLYWGREVIAKIRPGNAASAAAFQRAGYRYVADTTDGMMLFEWRSE